MGCLMGIRAHKSPPETGGLQDWRLEITDCRLARVGLFSLASKLAVGVYRVRARLRFLLLKFGVSGWVWLDCPGS